MNRKYIRTPLVALALLAVVPAYSEDQKPRDIPVQLAVTGVSEKVKEKFTSNLPNVTEFYRKIIKEENFPEKVEVVYSKDRGLIRTIINYNESQADNWVKYNYMYNKLVSVFLVLDARNPYGMVMDYLCSLKHQAQKVNYGEFYGIDQSINSFDCIVRLVKKNGDYVEFYGYTITNSFGNFNSALRPYVVLKQGRNKPISITTTEDRLLLKHTFCLPSPVKPNGKFREVKLLYDFFGITEYSSL